MQQPDPGCLHLSSALPVSPVVELQTAIYPFENNCVRSHLSSQISETFLLASKKAQTVFHVCRSCLLWAFCIPASAHPSIPYSGCSGHKPLCCLHSPSTLVLSQCLCAFWFLYLCCPPRISEWLIPSLFRPFCYFIRMCSYQICIS